MRTQPFYFIFYVLILREKEGERHLFVPLIDAFIG